MPKETAPKSIDASVVQEVLDEISKARREAHADFNRVTRDLQAKIQQVNEDDRPVAVAYQDAQADLAAHARFEARMKRQDFDARKRLLERSLADAQAAFRAAQRRAEEAIAPLTERQKAAAAKCQELAREWAAHQRIAKAAGVDLKAYWTPESGEPAEAPEDLEEPLVAM